MTSSVLCPAAALRVVPALQGRSYRAGLLFQHPRCCRRGRNNGSWMWSFGPGIRPGLFLGEVSMLAVLMARLVLILGLPLIGAWLAFSLSSDRWGFDRTALVSLLAVLALSVVLAGPTS